MARQALIAVLLYALVASSPRCWHGLLQRTMMHLDIRVDDLDAVGAHAVAAGAVLAQYSRRRRSGYTSTRPATHSACSATSARADQGADPGQHGCEALARAATLKVYRLRHSRAERLLARTPS